VDISLEDRSAQESEAGRGLNGDDDEKKLEMFAECTFANSIGEPSSATYSYLGGDVTRLNELFPAE